MFHLLEPSGYYSNPFKICSCGKRDGGNQSSARDTQAAQGWEAVDRGTGQSQSYSLDPASSKACASAQTGMGEGWRWWGEGWRWWGGGQVREPRGTFQPKLFNNIKWCWCTDGIITALGEDGGKKIVFAKSVSDIKFISAGQTTSQKSLSFKVSPLYPTMPTAILQIFPGAEFLFFHCIHLSCKHLTKKCRTI